MKLVTKLAAGVATTAVLTALGSAAFAQDITSAVRGVVTAPDGSPVSGTSVTITNTNTGAQRTASTTSTGLFSFRNLPVGGPYTVEVEGGQFADEQLDGVFTSLGDTTSLRFDLESQAETIVITASAIDAAPVAIGPSATFGLDQLQTLPAINRDIKDIIRTDPRVFVDESFVDAVQCAGANPRFNSLTVDGVRLNDSFGLNSNGFPTQRIPFSFDAIQQVAVELSPFDVEYGGFTACNINAVTKSGTNEFHGGAFFDITNDTLTGGSLEGEDVRVGDFSETRFGATLGGPIIKDKLFFFASYEKLNGADTFDRGPEGSGAVVEVLGFTQADFDEILDIAREVYQYDPGFLPESLDNSDEKILAKLDWNINDQHRASFTYNYNDGFNNTESDGDPDEFEYSNHLYERGAKLTSYVGSIYSDWTDAFSTEVRVGYLELDNRQISLGGTDFGEFQIGVDDGVNSATIYIGGDDSRQSNKLKYDVFTTVFKADYQWNDHLFTVGYEREALEVFNLFVQHTETQIEFDTIDDFRNGIFTDLDYANSPTLNPADAAAEWGYAIHTVYGQDEFFMPDMNLTLTAGLRYDWYTTDDAPGENPDFTAAYGFSNSQNLDGKGLLQPRFGFSWEPSDVWTVRGGAGLYSGGNPNVWLSNNFSSNNILQRTLNEGDLEDLGLFDEGVTSVFDLVYENAEEGRPNGPGFGEPAALRQALVDGVGGNFEINFLDPDFDLPADWKFSLGTTFLADVPINNFLGGEYTLNADLLYSMGRDTAAVQRGDLEPAAPIVGGLVPRFTSPNPVNSFVLTNANEDNEAFNASFSISKDYDNGLNWMFGYAYSDAKDEQPMTSSVAFSNYQNRAFINPQGDGLSESNYNIDHRLVLTATYEKDFIPEHFTKIAFVTTANSGRPYSFTFARNRGFFGFNPFVDAANSLLYVPTGESDPLVDFAADFDTDGFFAYLEENDISQYAGGFAPRNAFNSHWWTKVDLKIEQEFPAPVFGGKLAGFIIIDNLTNLINDHWGILEQADFPRVNGIVDVDFSDDNSQFVFERFRPLDPEPRVGDASLWSVRFGMKYDF